MAAIPSGVNTLILTEMRLPFPKRPENRSVSGSIGSAASETAVGLGAHQISSVWRWPRKTTIGRSSRCPCRSTSPRGVRPGFARFGGRFAGQSPQFVG